MTAFTCQICFEQGQLRFELPKLSTGNGDVLRASDCGHAFCRACMGSYVAARVEEQYVFHLRCPEPGCSNELHEQDLRRLVRSGALDAAVADRFAEIRARDYSTRAKVLQQQMHKLVLSNEADFMLAKRLCKTTRMCPRCNVIIEKSSGCNSFHCICGHAFNFVSAPTLLGGGSGIDDYSKVIALAKNRNMSLSTAELHHRANLGDKDARAKIYEAQKARRMSKRAAKLASQAGMSLQEAEEIFQAAQAGDSAAQLRIQRARGSVVPVEESLIAPAAETQPGSGAPNAQSLDGLA